MRVLGKTDSLCTLDGSSMGMFPYLPQQMGLEYIATLSTLSITCLYYTLILRALIAN